MIDLCYGSVGGAYISLPMSSFCASYHNSVYLMPMYEPSFRCLKRVERTVKCWSKESVSSLQPCFDCTDWQCFLMLVMTLMNYFTCLRHMLHSVFSVIPTKKVVTYPNNKLCVIKELKSVINKKKKKQTYYTSDALEKKVVSRGV